MRTKICLVVTMLGAIACLAANGEQPTTKPSGPAAETVTAFLQDLGTGKAADALKLWDSKAVDEKLKARIEKMAAKVKGFGGVKRVDVGTCEGRRLKRDQERFGANIDVVPVEIICGDGNLLLAVFTVRDVSSAPRIYQLESLKEWGGTASLDEELQYQH